MLVSFVIDQWSHDCMAMVLKCIQYIKESLLLLKDLSELWRVRYTNISEVSKIVHIDKIDGIIGKYNKETKMKPGDVKPCASIEYVA